MRCGMDFSRSPAQRRRARERDFYRMLACALLLGGTLAALPGMRIVLHTASLQEANALLTGELQAQAPQARQASVLRSRIAALEKQLAGHQQLGRRRHQAGLLQGDRGELRGQATSAQEVRDFAAALGAAGLEGSTLHDLQAEDGAYAFTLAIPLASSLPASGRAAP